MAKEDKGKIRMTVIHFETESDNATLQENIRSIAGTLSRALANPQRVVSSSAPAQLTSANGKDANTTVLEEVSDADASEEELSPIVSSSKKSAKPPKLRIPQPLNIDLTEGPMPLKQFLDEKKPENEIKKYLAIT